MCQLAAAIAIGTSVMMHIDDTIQALVDHIVDDLMHTCHPGSIHLAVLIHMIIPGNRHANSTKAGILHHLQQLGLCNRLSPAGFRVESLLPPIGGIRHVCHRLVVGFKGITHIPSQAHIFHSLTGRFEISGLCLESPHKKQAC